MKCVSYNIQFGFGLDGRFEIERIIDAVRGADIIALQEVTRNSPMNDYRDLVADIRAALPEYFSVFGPNLELDVGSAIVDGRAVDKHFQFGNMILSKTPISMSRNLLLPRTRSYDKLNLQRGALETVIETPFGYIRFYSTHLDHRGADERLLQINFLRERLVNYFLEGGAVSGISEMGFPEPPTPEMFVVMGDFNMLPGSLEFTAFAGLPDHEFGAPQVARYAVDAALKAAGSGAPQTTWVDPEDIANTDRFKRLDYCFVHAALSSRVKSSWVDDKAIGSDHQPLWVEFE